MKFLNITKAPACLLPNITRQLDCHMDTTQFADCSTDLQSVLKAVAPFFSFRLGTGLELQQKMKLSTLVSTEALKRPACGFQQTRQKSAHFYDPFKPQEPTGLRWKLYTRDIRNLALGFLPGSDQK